jgi:hypothetical protein
MQEISVQFRRFPQSIYNWSRRTQVPAGSCRRIAEPHPSLQPRSRGAQPMRTGRLSSRPGGRCSSFTSPSIRRSPSKLLASLLPMRSSNRPRDLRIGIDHCCHSQPDGSAGVTASGRNVSTRPARATSGSDHHGCSAAETPPTKRRSRPTPRRANTPDLT